MVSRPPRWRRWLSPLGAFVGIALAAIALVSGLVSLSPLWPAFSVSAKPPLDPESPLSARFVVEYQALLPAAVSLFCGFDSIRFQKGGDFSGFAGSGPPADMSFNPGVMHRGDRTSLECANTQLLYIDPHVSIAAAEVTIFARYRPVFIPGWLGIRWEKPYHYSGVRRVDGGWDWDPQMPESKSLKSYSTIKAGKGQAGRLIEIIPSRK